MALKYFGIYVNLTLLSRFLKKLGVSVSFIEKILKVLIQDKKNNSEVRFFPSKLKKKKNRLNCSTNFIMSTCVKALHLADTDSLNIVVFR